jgi:hypothetical protein
MTDTLLIKHQIGEKTNFNQLEFFLRGKKEKESGEEESIVKRDVLKDPFKFVKHFDPDQQGFNVFKRQPVLVQFLVYSIQICHNFLHLS